MEPLKTLIALAMASMAAVVQAAAPKVAVFDFEFVDTSIEGATNSPRSDERVRLVRLDRETRQRLAQSGRADVVDIARVADRTRQGFANVRRLRRGIRERTGSQVLDDGMGPEGVQPHSQHEHRCA